jgi:hypothetical protein
MLEGQKTMNSIPPWGRQGAHYTQQENKSQRYVAWLLTRATIPPWHTS